MNCPDCHHSPSCRFNAAGQQCYCTCHDIADDAPELLFMLTTIVAQARGGHVLDVTATEAVKLVAKHNNGVTDMLIDKIRRKKKKS